MENTRKHFPVLHQYIYANTASAGLLSEPLMNWRQEHDLDFLIGGSKMKTKSMQELLPATKETVARFFGSKIENTALVQNFSLGLNILLEGLNTESHILLVKDDYPSVNWPFECRGFQLDYAELDGQIEENILDKLRGKKFSVLALSLVQWASGIKLEMSFLKKVKEEFPDLLIIADGTQYCGTEQFNFEESPLDVLGTSAYKWLISGYGNGFMLFKDYVRHLSKVQTTGFYSSNINLNGRDDISFAKHFEPGHLDTLNFGSLKFSLEYLEKLGMSKVEQHLKMLSQKAKSAYNSLGLLNDDILKRNSHSTIFNINGGDEVFKKLTDEGVLASQRGNGIRMSFHFYNNESDIDDTVKILQSVV
ncbi:MAG: aminotransferase [Pseudozobellia sp.]|nr:aminotransferase [Pseudozobellia sp.]MBG47042.1 aminotransferase [Pseudozobellia sp.]